MKKMIVMCFILINLFSIPLYCEESSFAVGLGLDFFNYSPDEIYLSLDLSYLRELGDDFVLRIGTGFELTTLPRFLVPLVFGLNFYFPIKERFEFFLGFGLAPIFKIGPGTEGDSEDSALFRFYIGPYVSGGARVRVHKYMKLYIELQQDLLIGPPRWINNSTRIHGGICFSLPSK